MKRLRVLKVVFSVLGLAAVIALLLAGGDTEKINQLIEEIRFGPIEAPTEPGAVAPLRWHPMKHSIDDYRRMQPGRTLVILFSSYWGSTSLVLKKQLTASQHFREAVDSEGALLLEADYMDPDSIAARELEARGRIARTEILVLKSGRDPHWIELGDFGNVDEYVRKSEAQLVDLLTPTLLRETH